MRKTKQKQKQKQSQSTNINIKIGDVRKRRATKQTANKKSDENNNKPSFPKVLTQYIGQGVPLQSQIQSITNLNDYIKKTDMQNLQQEFITALQNEMKPKILLPQITPSPKIFEPSTVFSPGLEVGPSSNYMLPNLTVGIPPIEKPDLSYQLGPVIPLDDGKEEAGVAPEETEALTPGESLTQSSDPSLIMDVFILKKPLYDTGIDFHYILRSEKVSERIYLNIANTAFFYNGDFVNSNTILSKNPKALLKSLLREKKIVYDANEPNKVNWVGVD